jgi:hypothetical protein
MNRREKKAQKRTDRRIKKAGGKKIRRGADKGKWDMKKAVKREKKRHA